MAYTPRKGENLAPMANRLPGNSPAVLLFLGGTIELSQFAPPEYCGAQGVDVKTTLQSLTAIEIADAPEPVSDRAVSFSAAREKLRSSATVMKTFSVLSSMVVL